MYLTDVKSNFLPWIFADAGLLGGLLLVASRGLITMAPQLAIGGTYEHMSMQYKDECIKSINMAIASEGATVSDATIAKTLFVCSDEVCLAMACEQKANRADHH